MSFSSAGAFAAESKVSFPPCTTASTESDRKAAQGAFAAGQGSFNEADYATAITYWRDAYKRDCTAHALLLNLARAFELKGDRAEAITSLETYLQRKPDAPDADQIKRRIDNMKAQQISSSAAAPIPSTAPVATAPVTSPTPPPPAVDSGRSNGRSVLPLVLLGGAGVVLGVVGVVMISGGASKVTAAENTPATGGKPGELACPNRNCDIKLHPEYQALVIDKGNSGRSQELLGGVFVGLGVAAIGVGAIVYLTSSPGASNAHAPAGFVVAKNTSVTPTVAPGFAGLSLAGHF